MTKAHTPLHACAANAAKLRRAAIRLGDKHPALVLWCLFVGFPLGMLLAIGACTTVITLPIAWVFGWL